MIVVAAVAGFSAGWLAASVFWFVMSLKYIWKRRDRGE